MRASIAALLAGGKVTDFWADPTELWKIPGVNAPRKQRHITGDGLTDS